MLHACHTILLSQGSKDSNIVCLLQRLATSIFMSSRKLLRASTFLINSVYNHMATLQSLIPGAPVKVFTHHLLNNTENMYFPFFLFLYLSYSVLCPWMKKKESLASCFTNKIIKSVWRVILFVGKSAEILSGDMRCLADQQRGRK